MKFTYFGYDFFDNCLAYLLDQEHELVALCTFDADEMYNSTQSVTRLATKCGAPIIRQKLKEKDMVQLVSESDFLISAAYPYHIPIVSDWNVKACNIHPSLLPKGRGVWPLPHVILKQEMETGVTIHTLTAEFDAGDILLQQSCKVHPQENLETLTFQTRAIAKELLSRLFEDPETYWKQATKQNEGDASIWPMPTDEEMKLDFTTDVKTIDRIMRAFGKMHSFFEYDSTEYLVESATVWEETHVYVPGTLVDRTRGEWLFACLDGFVCVRHWKLNEM